MAMKYLHVIVLQSRRILFIVVGVITFGWGILWGGGQDFSWAAPGQNPYLQTAPTRPPTLTPSPPTPTPTPLAAPPISPPEKDDEGKDETIPAQPTENEDNQNPDKNSLPPLLEQEDDGHDDKALPPPAPQKEDDADQDELPPAQFPEREDNQDRALGSFQQADLSLGKAVDHAAPKMGEIITFTITISNSGPDTATGVVANDSLPVGLVLSSVSVSQGHYDGRMGIWTVGTIFPGESVLLSMVATAANASVVTNTAEIVAADQFDPDSTPANGLPEEDDQDSASIIVSSENSPITQPHGNPDIVDTTSTSLVKAQALSDQGGWLYWLYALVLGVVLLLMGLYLVNRA